MQEYAVQNALLAMLLVFTMVKGGCNLTAQMQLA
jgi:hypothetical protein